MKKLLVFVISIAMLLAFSMPAWASAWKISNNPDGTNIVFDFDTNEINPWEFGLYQLDSESTRVMLASSSNRSGSGVQLVYDDFNNPSKVQVLGDSTKFVETDTSGFFGFYFKYDQNGTEIFDKNFDFGLIPMDPPGSNTDDWYFSITDFSTSGPSLGQAEIMAIDFTPVPIPGAALLLGSGLIGLVGFRRRRNES